MFCTKCGCRIPSNAAKCPNCGEELSSMEYCGGFWFELNQNSLARKSSMRSSEPEAHTQNGTAIDVRLSRQEESPIQKERKANLKGSLFKYAVIVESAIIVTILLFSTLSNSSLSKEVERLKTKIEETEKKYSTLETEYNDLKKHNQNAEGNYGVLQEEKSVLDEQNRELEKQNKEYASKIESLETELESLRKEQLQEKDEPADDENSVQTEGAAQEPDTPVENPDATDQADGDNILQKEDKKDTNVPLTGFYNRDAHKKP